MVRHSLQILLVICVYITGGRCDYRYRDHHNDHHHTSQRSRDHQDPQQDSLMHFYADIHHPSPGQVHHQTFGHGMSSKFQHGHDIHERGHGFHGHHLEKYGRGFHGYHRDDDQDDDDQHHRDNRLHSDRHSDQDHQKNHHDEEEHDHIDDTIWRFQIGDNFGAYEYLDADGHAKGFHIDLMRAVCQKAGKTCYFIIDAYHNCWNTQGGQERPGIGLMDHYYDGCIGNLPTPDRLNSFNFTLPFSPNVRCGLLYKPGLELTSAQAHNVSGKRIGFVDGWALSKRCFERQEGYVGNSPGEYIPVLFETHKEMTRALLQGKVNAVLTVDALDSDELHISLVEPTFSCTLGGSSVMTMYGSKVLDWWNDAFQQKKEDGSFRQLCIRSIAEHGHKGRIDCLYN